MAENKVHRQNTHGIDQDLMEHDAMGEKELGQCVCCPSDLSCFLGTIFPCLWPCACVVVQEREEVVCLNFGKYCGTLKKPGIYYVNPMGMENRKVATVQESVDLGDVKVLDAKGSPLKVSGVVVYRIEDTKRASIDVSNPRAFITTQALSVMKQVCSLYPYEARDEETPTLRSSALQINKSMIEQLQVRMKPAGVRVINFELTDLSYSQEIAQAMLIRQQAEAMVDARKTIVDGACLIARDAIAQLSEGGYDFTQEQKASLMNNLLVVICGDAGAQPTIPLR